MISFITLLLGCIVFVFSVALISTCETGEAVAVIFTMYLFGGVLAFTFWVMMGGFA